MFEMHKDVDVKPKRGDTTYQFLVGRISLHLSRELALEDIRWSVKRIKHLHVWRVTGTIRD